MFLLGPAIVCYVWSCFFHAAIVFSVWSCFWREEAGAAEPDTWRDWNSGVQFHDISFPGWSTKYAYILWKSYIGCSCLMHMQSLISHGEHVKEPLGRIVEVKCVIFQMVLANIASGMKLMTMLLFSFLLNRLSLSLSLGMGTLEDLNLYPNGLSLLNWTRLICYPSRVQYIS